MANPVISANPMVSSYIESISRKGNELSATLEDRTHALELARNASIPSVLEEEWRKTNPNDFPWDRIEQTDLNNTVHNNTLNSFDGSLVQGIQQLTSTDDEIVKKMLMIPGDDYDTKFLYYHKALARDLVCYRIPKNFKGTPLELIQKTSGPGLASFTSVFIVESGAQATIYDRWESAEDTLAVGRTSVLVEPNAHLTYIQEDDFTPHTALYRRARIQLERDAKLDWISLTPGCGWHAARLQVILNGSGTEANLSGLCTGSGDVRMDHNTLQYHGAPNAYSNLLFKILLAGHSRSVFQGLIEVPKQSQKTDAYQTCRNMLLDKGTHADAMPKLEIIANDVKCSHGVSVGSINENQLFYLQNRGLSRRKAMTVIATGFAEEVVNKVPIESVAERWRTIVASTIDHSEM